MSEYTMEYLDAMTRVGFTDKRKAWTWRAGKSNHFPGPVPDQEILDLFAQARGIEGPALTTLNGQPIVDSSRKAIITPDMPGGPVVQGYVGEHYPIHQFKETLFDIMKPYTNGETGFSSAGLLKNGAVAWLQIEAPENREAAGLQYRAGLLGWTSLNGTMATGFKGTGTFVVCDNTFAWALYGGEDVKVRHTRHSLDKLKDSGEALAEINALADRIGYAVQSAADQKVTEAQFEAFLAELFPVPAEKNDKTGRGKTLALSKRSDVAHLYQNDDRAKPWKGTALGVMQAVNTYTNHKAAVRGVSHRAERVAENQVSGKLSELDALAMRTLYKFLVAA